MFERFTDGARRAVTDAQVVARRLGHDRIGTEHVLLGLVEGDGVAAQVLGGAGVTLGRGRARDPAEVGRGPLGAGDAEALGAIGIDLDEVRRRIEAASARAPCTGTRPPLPRRRPPMLGGHIPFSPRAKKALELSLREALALKHNYIGTEHVLLGIVREGEGLGMLALTRLGAGPQLIRARVLDALRSTG